MNKKLKKEFLVQCVLKDCNINPDSVELSEIFSVISKNIRGYLYVIEDYVQLASEEEKKQMESLISSELCDDEIYTLVKNTENSTLLSILINIIIGKGVSIEKLTDAIFKTIDMDAEYIYQFVRNVEGAPVKKLADAIAKE